MRKPQQHFLQIDDQRIAYEIKEGTRQRKNITIQIKTCGSVKVMIPRRVAFKHAVAWAEEKAQWIYQQRKIAQKNAALKKEKVYQQGSLHYYLGSEYPLRLIKGESKAVFNISTTPNKKPKLHLDDGAWFLSLAEDREEEIKQCFDSFYKDNAKVFFSQRLHELVNLTHWVKVIPNLKVRKMKTRWGSYSPKGNVNLNTELMKFPVICIDYVILHELCHVKEMNHSKRFYALMDEVMPQWREVKRQLETLAHVV